jgi:phosphonate transport system permease protein
MWGSEFRWTRAGSALAFLCICAFCWQAAEIRPLVLIDGDALASAWAFVRASFPPDFSLPFLKIVVSAIGQTLAIAIAGTVLSILIGLPLGVLSSAALWRRGVLLEGEAIGPSIRLLAVMSHLANAVLGFLRAVPDLLWGLLFVVALGLGSVAGTLGLAMAYGGMLGRVYADVFEDVDSRPLEALYAGGAGRAQIFLRAVWPQALPGVIAYTLYSLECSMRAASVLGFVGAGGIGYEINLSMRMFEYNQVSTLVLSFVVLLTVNDAVSRIVRERLLGRRSSQGKRVVPAIRVKSHTVERGRVWIAGAATSIAGLLPWILMMAAIVGSFYAVGFTHSVLGMDSASRVARFVGRMFPADFDKAFLSELVGPLFQTVGISVIGTLLGVLIGGLLMLPATSTLTLVRSDAAGRHTLIERSVRWFVYRFARLVYTFLRSIPELVWVLLLIIAVGPGPFAATLAIGLHTGGVLGKLYAETLEDVATAPIDALRAGGARRVGILLWGLWPHARPMLTSYTLLRWEMNVRVSTILGLVGGGGLGQAVYHNLQLGFYPRLTTLILIIYAVVLVSDWIGDKIRARQSVGARPCVSSLPSFGPTPTAPAA